MPLVKPSCVQDLKMRINIVDVVSRVVTLKKAGSQYKGLSPFNQEKTPSFYVSPDKGFYKCFSSGKAGDIIAFVRETEQLTFTEAVEALGQRFNIPIEYEEGSGPSREERSLRQELFELHDIAAQHFHDQFRTNDETGTWMQAYWKDQRKFSPELAEEFKIGAADANGSGLGGVLLEKKFSEAALRQCGLFFIYDDAEITLRSLRPRFRGRLMVPIRDHQGRVVAFTARQTDLTPDNDPAKEAKYVNSPETPIFTKSHLLFNLDRARSEAGDDHPFVLVEGQLDALRCWSVGLKTAVAPQGTSITDGQLGLMRRYHYQVECFFDGDGAGQKAALRFLPMALKAGLDVKFLTGEAGQKIDPDDVMREQGLAGYEALKSRAQSSMAFACHSLLPEGRTAPAERKTAALRPLFEIVVNAESEVARSEFLKESASHLGLDLGAVAADFDRFKSRAGRWNQAPAPPSSAESVAPANTRPKTITPEEHLLLICLHFEDLGPPLSQALPADWIDSNHPAGALLNRVLAEFEQDAWPGSAQLADSDLLENDAERALIASLLFDTPQMDDPAKVAEEGLHKLRLRALQPRLKQIELALSQTTPDSDSDAISLLKERSNLQRQLRQPVKLVGVV